MKLRHPLAIRSAAWIISLGLRAWMAGIRMEQVIWDADTDPRNRPEQAIYLLWHENLLLPAVRYAPLNFAALISQHRDGELITQIYRRLGGSAVRGSSTRGGDRAMRQLMTTLKSRHVIITPDGPRGPRRVVQQGAVFLASQVQRPIIPLGLHVNSAWRAGSWDRMVLPRPFTSARIVVGRAVTVPPGLTKQTLAPWLKVCQTAMDQTQRMAETGDYSPLAALPTR